MTNSDDTIAIILIYVDDIIIIGNNENEIKKIKNYLKEKFDIKDLGKLKYFLGIEITHSREKCLFLSQKKYILDLLKRN
jgi:Reverse transcriptase (RNA-dependent DNA polymerase)